VPNASKNIESFIYYNLIKLLMLNITIYAVLLLPVILLFLIFYDSNDITNLQIKNIISKAINLNQSITQLKINLQILLNNSDENEFISEITEDTFLTHNQYTLLKYIEYLEELFNEWEILNSKNLINNSLITSPFIIAYRIREIINTTINIDEDNNPVVWLSKDEILCIKKSKYNKVKKVLKESSTEDSCEEEHLYKTS
jgi:hypothetical protein